MAEETTSKSFEKKNTKSMSLAISKLLAFSKRKKIKNDPVALKEVTDYIQQLKEERSILRKEQQTVIGKGLIDNAKALLVDLRSKEFKKQLFSKTTLLRRIPTLSEILAEYNK